MRDACSYPLGQQPSPIIERKDREMSSPSAFIPRVSLSFSLYGVSSLHLYQYESLRSFCIPQVGKYYIFLFFSLSLFFFFFGMIQVMWGIQHDFSFFSVHFISQYLRTLQFSFLPLGYMCIGISIFSRIGSFSFTKEHY